MLRGVKGISFIHFDERDVVRHSLVQRIVKAYEKYNETDGRGTAADAAGCPTTPPRRRLNRRPSAAAS